MKYRSEIDGLRSLAIVPVVAFHAGIQAFSGGFTGVDIFFVISGYLITSILIGDFEANKFSIAEFYKRRTLRILPALTVVLLATAIAAFTLMLPIEFAEVGKSLTAATLFASNIFFWLTSNYFDTPSDTKPLLHTWSLSVEEQFYIFIPLILWAVYRFRNGKWVGPVLGAIVGASFIANIVMLPKDPSGTFYLLPTRAWELGIGALVAVGYCPKVAAAQWRDALALLGLAAIAFSVFFITEEMAFPGWYALVPCIGAALIIAYSQGTWVGTVLSLRPIVWVGKISYSLYLWHWPIIVFYKVRFGEELGSLDVAIVVSASFALAALSYRFVEQPFRKAGWRLTPSSRILASATAALVLLCIGGATIFRLGPTSPFYPREVLELSSFSADYTSTPEYRYQFRAGKCFLTSSDTGKDIADECLRRDETKKNFLLIGDSHGAHLWRAIALQYPDINLMQATASGCRPLHNGGGEERCLKVMRDIFDKFIPSQKLDGVILAGRWNKKDLKKLAETVIYLKQKTQDVVVVGPTIEYKGSLPLLLAKSIYYSDPSIPESSIDENRQKGGIEVGRVVTSSGASYVPLQDILCPEGKCHQRSANGQPVDFDYGHFTLDGAKMVAAEFPKYWTPKLN